MFRDFRGIVVATSFSSTVPHEVFWTSCNAIRRVQPRALIAADIRTGHRGAEKWIFTGAFGHSAPASISRNIYHRREGPADSASRSLLRGDAGSLLHELWIPARGQP